MKHLRGAVLGALALVSLGSLAHAQAAPTPGTRAPRQSWTSDRRTFGEGDVITVLVDEHTIAAALKGTVNSNSRFRDLSVGVDQAVMPTLPKVKADISSSDEAESRQRGDMTRENRFQGEMTVRVTGVEPNGLLRIEGKKMINVDKNSEELTLSGYVRPQDVSHGNVVDSWRVADAQLLYTSKGSLGKAKSGFISKILGAFWP